MLFDRDFISTERFVNDAALYAGIGRHTLLIAGHIEYGVATACSQSFESITPCMNTRIVPGRKRWILAGWGSTRADQASRWLEIQRIPAVVLPFIPQIG